MKKLKYISVVICVVFIFSFGYNIYQYSRIKEAKKGLAFNVTKNLQEFAGKCGNTENEMIFTEQYGNIVAAHESYCILSENNGILSEEWAYSLPGLLLAIKDVMINDKEKFKEVFEGTDTPNLMFKISNNFEDRESINKLYNLLKN